MTIEGKDQRATEPDELTASDLELAKHLDGFVDDYSRGKLSTLREFLLEHPETPSELLKDLETFSTVSSIVSDKTVPSRFGDFEILRELGRGGMGIVYEARQVALDRKVALKVLPANLLSDPRAVVRFNREAIVAASLHHPNIVGVYAMGVDAGTPYFAMEFARGDTLEQILRRIGLRDERIREEVGGTTERLLKLMTILQLRKRAAGEGALVSPARLESAHGLPGSAQETAEGRLKDSYFVGIAEAFAAVADGLQHAHDHGIIHRDLKPSNLILDSDGCLRILDFGVARVANLPHLTLLEERIGTPLYMSPEQAQAPPGPLGPGTDVYSLGATLYEMLVFRPPLQGKDTQDTLDKIVHEDPSPPRKWNRVIPRDLETIVLKCLRKDPRQRYGTAEALAQDLRRFVRGEPIEARPQPLHVIFARRAWHARRTVFQTAGLVLALVAVGLFLINILVKAHERQVQLYEERVRQGVRSMLNKQLLWPRDQLITVKGEKILQSERRRDVPIQSRETDGSSRLIVASSLIVAGPALGDVGPDPLEEAVGFFKEAIDRFPSKPFAHFHLARALLLQGRLRQAKREIEITLKLKPGFLPALSLLASILERAGDAARAEAARAEVARRAPPEKDGWESAWMEAQQALVEQRWRDAAEAFDKLSSPKRQKEPYLAYDVETLLGRGVARLRAGKWYRDLALADFGAAAYRWADWLEPVLFQGRVLHSSGRIDAARQLFKRCFEKALEAQPGSKDEVAGAILSAYMEAGDWNEALSWADAMSDGYVKYLSNAELLNQRGDYERALAHAWDALSLRDDVATNIVLGNNHMARGDLESASLFYEAARQTAEEDPRPLVALGICREAQGYITDAENLFLGATLLDGAPGLAYYNLGRVLDTQGRYEEAVQAYENALSQDPGNALAHNNLAVLLDRQGKRYEARSHYFRAVELAHRFAGAHYNLGWALHRECRYAEAYREYREALELGLDDAILRGNLAATLQLGLGFEGEAYLDGAIQQYRAAIRANPEYPTNHLDLGTALYYRRSWEEAAESYRNYMKLDPLDDGVHYNLGLVLQEQGLVEQAVSSYREGLKLNPRQVWGHNALANLLLREAAPVPAGKELTDAIVLLEDAVRLDGAEESVHILLDKYRRALGDKLPSYASIDAAVDAPLCLAPEQGRFRYLRARTQPSLEDEWTLPDFNDATWEEGSAPFGRPEGGDVSTVIQGVKGSDDSLFLRCTFDNPMGLTARGLTLCVRSSGGFVVYLNGRAVARRAAAEGAASDAVARQVKKAPWKAQEFPVDPADLHAGKNALAVQSLGLDREGEDFLMEVVLEARPVPAELKPQRAAERLEAFRAGMAGPGAATRLRYFEGRLLEMSGQMDGALQKFLSVIREDGSRPEPFIRAAECLRELGRLQEAERCLREALASGLSNHDFLWDAWLRLALVDLRSDPADVLKAFPARESEAAGKLTGHPADILWLLEQLAAENAIRINCGGANYAQKEFTWSRDRFFRSGRRYYLFRLNALYDGVDDAALYQTERYFVDPVLADSEGFFPGYRIPLPPGNYRVRLHFTEGHFTAAGKRRFDVLLEGKPVLEDYEPLDAEFGVPDKRSFDLPVDDGALEIDFKRRIENPKISAIEIERI